MTKRKTILFAEDDEVLLISYGKHLEKAGYRVITARDGLVTMNNLFQFAPDLLILDLMLPKFEGEKLLQFIWSPPRLTKVPVIILSSKSSVEPEYEILMKFAAKYLIKQDCTPAILLEAVREQISGEPQVKRATVAATSDDSVPSLIRWARKLHPAN
jgi:DNA-binding response OmpR family regulator